MRKNRHSFIWTSAVILAAVLLLGGMPPMELSVSAAVDFGWEEENGNWYWYEGGVRQGYDPDNADYRGKEIYDPGSDAWYWLDNVDQGKKAVSKDVYQESLAGNWADRADGTGKWVRYDEHGHMIKGWDTNENGTYYFDLTYGTMAKGDVTIDGQNYSFDTATGILQGIIPQNGWYIAGDNWYWYENGVRQGTEGRGKEIYDPETDAWYWLDSVDNGRKAVSKDVYQESYAGAFAEHEDGTGKWVRYDENGHMVKGWNEQDGKKYYFDPVTGAIAKGSVVIDGITYQFNVETGVNETSEEENLPGLNDAATVDNVMAVLRKYDPDGAYIMENVQQSGEDILWTYDFGDNVLEGIDVAVHENCHTYTFDNDGWRSEAIYVGGGQHILVNYTDVFYSTEMVPSIPENLRTFRFDTYINTDNTLMVSVQFGPYGLLNEFSAYCWGMNAAVKMFPYYKTFPAEPSTYFQYAGSAAGVVPAYAEFRYYILSYLLYAKEHYPQIYQGILQNEAFRTAYRKTDSIYAGVVREFWDNVDEIVCIMSENGYKAWVGGDYEMLWIDRSGISLFGGDYHKLMAEMEKPEYQQMIAELNKSN